MGKLSYAKVGIMLESVIKNVRASLVADSPGKWGVLFSK